MNFAVYLTYGSYFWQCGMSFQINFVCPMNMVLISCIYYVICGKKSGVKISAFRHLSCQEQDVISSQLNCHNSYCCEVYASETLL